MFTERTALFLYAETSVHLGSGEALGAIDLAIQRERVTDFPTAYATGLKGAARAWFRDEAGFPDALPPDPSDDDLRAVRPLWTVFGPDTDHAQDNAGAAAFTDARLALFPVRSVAGVFAWTTCPFALGRLARDLDLDAPPWARLAPAEGEAIGAATGSAVTLEGGTAVLDDYALPVRSDDDAVDRLATWLVRNALPEGEGYAWHQRHLAERLLVLPDDVFRDLVRHATEVQARVKLGPQKTTTDDGNLFYQENLPAESLFYTVVLAADGRRQEKHRGGAPPMAAAEVVSFLRHGDRALPNGGDRPGLDGARLQIGGDETTGKGIVHARFALGTHQPTA